MVDVLDQVAAEQEDFDRHLYLQLQILPHIQRSGVQRGE